MSENEWDSQAVAMAMIGSAGFCLRCNTDSCQVSLGQTVLSGSAVNQPYTFLPSLSPTSWATHTPTHTCTHGDRLELKLQDSPERNLHDWTSVEAEIQIVNQSDSVSLRSPHQHLIRRPPMSLKFPVRLAAPCKECHQHCTGFVDHIRYDHVLPAPSVPHFFFKLNLLEKEALLFGWKLFFLVCSCETNYFFLLFLCQFIWYCFRWEKYAFSGKIYLQTQLTFFKEIES